MKKFAVCMVVMLHLAAGTAVAANKTHLADTLGDGNSAGLINVYSLSETMKASFAVGAANNPGGSNTDTTMIEMGYLHGVTESLDLGVTLPFWVAQTYGMDMSTSVGNSSSSKLTRNGMGDFRFSARYALINKTAGGKGWLMYADISPSSAASDAGTAEVTVNGTTTTTGVSGKVGNGRLVWQAGTVYSSAEDWFGDISYKAYGSKTEAGAKNTPGSEIRLAAGTEKALNATTLFTPTLSIRMIGAGTYPGYTTKAYSIYGLNLVITHDPSEEFSIKFGIGYESHGQQKWTLTNGDTYTFNGSVLNFTVSGVYFF